MRLRYLVGWLANGEWRARGSPGRAKARPAATDSVNDISAIARAPGQSAAAKVRSGNEGVGIPGGHDLLTKVTGAGCALGAVLAAFAGVSASPFQAAVSGSAVYALAGERAARVAVGPGSLAVALLDSLFLIGTEHDELLGRRT